MIHFIQRRSVRFTSGVVTATTSLCTLLGKLCSTKLTTVIVGDFNLPKIDWANNSAVNDNVHDQLFNLFSNLGFYQFVSEPTRLNASGSDNILDLILCNNQLSVCGVSIKEPFSTSDHCIVDFRLYVDSLNNKPVDDVNSESGGSFALGDSANDITLPVLDWSRADFDGINNVLCTVDWHLLFGYCFDAESIWSGFKNIIWPIITSYVPNVHVRHNFKYRPRQYPKPIRTLLRRKAAIWRQLRNNHSPMLFDKYREIANLCRRSIVEFDIERERRMLNANNVGAFYKFVNNKVGRNHGVGPLSMNNVIFTSDWDKAAILNQYFESVFTNDNNILPDFPMRVNDCIDDIHVSPSIVLKILKKLKVNSAAGPDRLPPVFFNKTASVIAYPLSVIFRNLIDLRSLPSEWKISHVTPVFKKGAPTDPSNYRPISLNSCCCKILESIIAQDLLEFLDTHKLISKHQHGFLKKHSTTTNLLESLNDWSVSLSNNRSVVVAYIDFHRAFDSISHVKLIHKLKAYGIGGNLLAWISVFLINRF